MSQKFFKVAYFAYDWNSRSTFYLSLNMNCDALYKYYVRANVWIELTVIFSIFLFWEKFEDILSAHNETEYYRNLRLSAWTPIHLCLMAVSDIFDLRHKYASLAFRFIIGWGGNTS